MKSSRARRIAYTSTTALACALVAAALPAQAAQRRVSAPSHLRAEPVPPPSIPQDDAYTTSAGVALEIVAPGVVANDASYLGDGAVVTLVSGPSHGALALAADGGFSYSPAKGFVGQDSFRYGLTTRGEYGEANVSLSVNGTMDLALSGSVSAAAVEIGMPVTFTFDILNEGTGDADEVELVVTAPSFGQELADADTRAFGDSRCVIQQNGWLCSMGRMVSGATLQASFTFYPDHSAYVRLDGNVRSSQPDVDPADNTVKISTMAGRLSLNPGIVTGRTSWSEENKPGTKTSAEVAFANDTPAQLAFEAQLSEPGTKTVVPGWFWVTPANGTVDAWSSEALTVHMSPAGLQPGLKRGVVHFSHDSLFAVQDLPVSFTVAFLDVGVDRADDASIHALAGAGVTAGCRAGSFCPDDTLTRAGATVWLLLAREGRWFEPAAAEGLFQDVPVDRVEAPFIEDLARRGVADGCEAELFCPDQPLARADAAVMVIRMLEGVRYRPLASEPMFRDMRDDPRAAYVNDAVARGLFSACSEGDAFFCPQDGITRGDAAVSLVKAFELPLY